MGRYFNFNKREGDFIMNTKFCAYCGAELDEDGVCPLCGLHHE